MSGSRLFQIVKSSNMNRKAGGLLSTERLYSELSVLHLTPTDMSNVLGL